MQHPDLTLNHLATGCYHTTGGRALPARQAASIEEQEARIKADPGLWERHSLHEPVGRAVDGARSYARSMGLGDPHAKSFHEIKTDPGLVRTVGRAYDSLPDHDPAAVPAFHAMRDEVGRQFHHLTHNMGVHVSFTDHDPYKNAGEMIDDVKGNGRLQVLKTATTGHHPIFSDHENDQFRAVHDYFGHAATGRDFDRHGEEAAFHAHSRMFSPRARPALASETRGQNTSLVLNGGFGPQKVALLPQHMQGLHVPVKGEYGRTALRVVAHDSGDGETIYHCPFCGSGQVIARSDRTIECEFCHTCFTVQVQPQFNAFPQTINGMPVQVPGMPGQVGAGGGDPMQPDPAAASDPSMDPDDAGAPDPVDPDDADDDGPDDGSDDDGKPAFLKGSSLRTSTGALLPEADYVRHLAIRHSVDPARTAARVKAAR